MMRKEWRNEAEGWLGFALITLGRGFGRSLIGSGWVPPSQRQGVAKGLVGSYRLCVAKGLVAGFRPHNARVWLRV